MAQLIPIAIARDRRSLVAIVGEVLPFAAPRHDAESAVLSSFVLHRVPLDDSRAKHVPHASRLREAWAALARGRLDASALAEVLAICVLAPSEAQEVRLLPPLAAAPERPRASAAHPRAYRGTKLKPPKSAGGGLYDLRQHVSDREGVRVVRARLAEHTNEALELLRARGFDPRRLARLDGANDPFLAYHFGAAAMPALPRGFAPLLALLRDRPAAEIRRWAEVFHLLGLGESEPLRAMIVRLVHARPDERTLAWCRSLETLGGEHRITVATLLFETGAFNAAPPDDDFWERLTEAAPADRWSYRAYAALRGLREGATADYMLGGMVLARSQPNHRFLEIGTHCPRFRAASLEELAMRAKHLDSTSLWRYCGELEGLFETLLDIDFERFSPPAIDAFVRALTDLVYDDVTEAERAAKWKWARAHATDLAEVVAGAAAPVQPKVADFLGHCLWLWDAHELRVLMSPAVRLVTRLAEAPFAVRETDGTIFAWLITLDPKLVVGAPDRVLLAIERACRTDATSRRALRALRALAKERAPAALVMQALLEYPHRTFRALVSLGSLRLHHAQDVLRRFAAHPLCAPRILDLATDEQRDVLLTAVRDRLPSPLTRALRAHLEGTRRLRAGQLACARAHLARRMPLTRLGLLERLADVAVREPLGARDIPADALAFVAEADGNRRAFRRFLRARSSGDAAYLREHPATREWSRKHPRLDVSLWSTGIRTSGIVPVLGSVELELEQDPLEVLQLGAHVRSCLQPGGLCAYSAPAIVLDVNKQVIYARSASGRVVGRQLLAISKDDRLVAFHVYPQVAPRELRVLFRDYDEQFAKLLGLELYRDAEGDPCEIELVLASEWWDDGAWDLQVDG